MTLVNSSVVGNSVEIARLHKILGVRCLSGVPVHPYRWIWIGTVQRTGLYGVVAEEDFELQEWTGELAGQHGEKNVCALL